MFDGSNARPAILWMWTALATEGKWLRQSWFLEVEEPFVWKKGKMNVVQKVDG